MEPDQGRPTRVIEDQVPDRDGNRKNEPVLLVTIITDWRLAPAEQLARTYYQRWEHGNRERPAENFLARTGKVLRSGSPALIQEIWGYLLTH